MPSDVEPRADFPVRLVEQAGLGALAENAHEFSNSTSTPLNSNSPNEVCSYECVFMLVAGVGVLKRRPSMERVS